MLQHLAVAAVSLPVQFGLGFMNTRWRVLTRGEVRFWSIVIFVAVELAYLGAFG